MREIKFRGYDGMDWIYGSAVLCDADNWYMIENGGPDDDWVMVNRVGQYTGLKNKNGTEIYEGDILYREGYWGYYVAFENGCFVAVPLNKVQRINWDHHPVNSFGLDYWEIKGNIYENPNLLEEQS